MNDSAEYVRCEKQGRVVTITLDRPSARNAIGPEMDHRLRDIWAEFRDDDGADIAVLTGTGDAFCAGADRNTWFTQWLDADAAVVRRNAKGIGFAGITRGLHRIGKPVIAAVNGWALGAGLELALACDIRIASDRAMFGAPLVGLGFHHGDGGISRLVDACGLAVALDLELSGEPIDAQRALQVSLVTRVVAHDDLMSSAHALAHLIAAHEQHAVRSAKETVLDVIGHTLDDQLEREAMSAYSIDRQRAQRIVDALPLGSRAGGTTATGSATS